jgi:hypothetical protein
MGSALILFIRVGFCLFCSPHGNEKVIDCPTVMQSTIHVYEVRPRNDKRGVELIFDVLPFGGLWYDKSDHAISYAMHYSRSHDAVIRIYNDAGNLIQTHEHKGDFKQT